MNEPYPTDDNWEREDYKLLSTFVSKPANASSPAGAPEPKTPAGNDDTPANAASGKASEILTGNGETSANAASGKVSEV